MSKYLFILIITILSCVRQNENSPIRIKGGQQIFGQWKVVRCSFLPFAHNSFCTKLNLYSIFEFQTNGIVKVYENENAKSNCNNIQTFWIDSSGLNFFEYDFSFKYNLIKLTQHSLVINSKEVPQYLVKEEFEKARRVENDTIKEILQKGITIRMTRVNNGG